jgi:hypothetical protein
LNQTNLCSARCHFRKAVIRTSPKLFATIGTYPAADALCDRFPFFA